jgi:proprotein convertase subtilisin/kexin type 2
MLHFHPSAHHSFATSRGASRANFAKSLLALAAISLCLSACGGGGGVSSGSGNSSNAANLSQTEALASASTLAGEGLSSAASSTLPPATSGEAISLDTKAPDLDPNCAIRYVANVTNDESGPDPLLNKQWHLKNTGQAQGKVGEDLNVESAWTLSQGEGVRIALVDDALEVVHSDLKANVVPGQSYNYRPAVKGSSFPLPCNYDDSHGTSVAGIIASRGSNAIGTVGIAPKALLVGYNALALDLTADIADALNRDMANNAIYNNSWGSPDEGVLNASEPEFDAAIEKGLRLGRQGKGSIFVFPAGNGGCYQVSGSGACQKDNSNFDGYLNHLGVITVGAVDQHGRMPWYGERGSNILVSAPGGDGSAGITTTAISNAYRSDFAGTSASAPMASGVIALMLGVNPKLSWRDVPIILARTARKNDASDPEWAGRFNHKYGFGVIDASAAVKMASAWTSVGNTHTLKRCEISSEEISAIPDGGDAIRSALKLNDCAISMIEYVSVAVQIDHGYSGDLQIDLTAPSGSSSNLATPRLCGSNDRSKDQCGSLSQWTFASVRHLDERAAGEWRLTVQDRVSGQVGRLQGWRLTVFGR